MIYFYSRPAAEKKYDEWICSTVAMEYIDEHIDLYTNVSQWY